MTGTTDETGTQRRKPAWPLAILIVSVGSTSLLLGSLAQESISTWLYAQAFDRFTTAHTSAEQASADYLGLIDRAERASSHSDSLAAVADPAYVDATAIAAMTDAADTLAAAIEQAPTAALDPEPRHPAPADLGTPAWERYAAVWRLIESRDTRLREADELEAASDEMAAARRGALATQDSLFEALAASAEHVLANHPSATNRSRIALRHAIDQEGSGWTHADGSTSAFSATVLAIDEVRSSHAAEEARRVEPEYPVRAEIEAFARSISAGVALDFIWSYEVNGLPSDGWYSGTAEFWPTDGGWGSINLTHSISDNWYDDPNAKAVVVHEVGHTQVVRPACEPLFSGSEFSGDHEMWATAWAIGMGYDIPGSGIEAYGRPSDAQIAVAAQCR